MTEEMNGTMDRAYNEFIIIFTSTSRHISDTL